MKYQNDFNLVQGILSGDSSSLEEFYNRFLPLIQVKIRDKTTLLSSDKIEDISRDIIQHILFNVEISFHFNIPMGYRKKFRKENKAFIEYYNGEDASLVTYLFPFIHKLIGICLKKDSYPYIELDHLGHKSMYGTEERVEKRTLEELKVYPVSFFEQDYDHLEILLSTNYPFLSPEEIKALTLLSDGFNYEEIGKELGFKKAGSQTKRSQIRVKIHRLLKKAIQNIIEHEKK